MVAECITGTVEGGGVPTALKVRVDGAGGGEAQARLLEESKLAWRREKEHDLGLGS